MLNTEIHNEMHGQQNVKIKEIFAFRGTKASTLVTQELQIAAGICIRPWQWFALGKAESRLLVTSNRCIPVQSTVDRSAVEFCGACKIMHLLSVVFCVVGVVHQFNFSVVINQTPNKWRPLERGTCVFGGIYIL